MAKKSAGILIYKISTDGPDIIRNTLVLLLHPGGPFWKNKEEGAWSIPKGEFEADEDPLKAAIRETEEETGLRPGGDFIELQPVRQKSGKVVYAWAWQGDFDTSLLHSNTFQMQWPPRSGKMANFPEIDKAGWFNLEEARISILQYQLPFLDELEKLLKNK